MKKVFLIACSVVLIVSANAQSNSAILEKNRAFTGAVPTLKSYNAIYQLDSNDPKIIEKAIRNINNALIDPRLAGKIQIELITFGGGTEAIVKESKYESDIKALAEKGVIVSQCNNSMRERKLTRDMIFDFVAVVPSGNGELILRQAEGWSVIKP